MKLEKHIINKFNKIKEIDQDGNASLLFTKRLDSAKRRAVSHRDNLFR